MGKFELSLFCCECGDNFHSFSTRKYCGDNCKREVRNRAQADKRKSRGDDAIVDDIFKNYQNRASNRGIDFALTFDYFKRYMHSPCYYCGDALKAVGFDRVENAVGYIESNCVPCCTLCNLMKRHISETAFINKCRQISKHHPNESSI